MHRAAVKRQIGFLYLYALKTTIHFTKQDCKNLNIPSVINAPCTMNNIQIDINSSPSPSAPARFAGYGFSSGPGHLNLIRNMHHNHLSCKQLRCTALLLHNPTTY